MDTQYCCLIERLAGERDVDFVFLPFASSFSDIPVGYVLLHALFLNWMK